MKTITRNELFAMSIKPLIRSIKRWYLKQQLRSIDRHMDVTNHNIKNEQQVLRVLSKDRMNVVSRLRGL